MSNIPSSAMPHAGGQSNTNDTSSGSSSSGQFTSGQGATTTGGAGTSGQFTSGQSSSTTGQSGSSHYQPSQSQQSQYQPSQSYDSSYEGRETIQRTRRRDTVMEKARDNKTGIALGMVGAAAAAAIPFLLSKRNKSKEQYREFPVNVDNRTQASDSYSANDSFSTKDRNTKNNY